MIIVDSFHKYCEKEFNLSELDSVKLKYSLELIVGDLSKFLILFFLFSVLGYRNDYIYSALTLLTIRVFTGGLHFKTYTGCLIFSGLFFYTSIFLKNNIILSSAIIVALFIISVLIIVIFAPVCVKSRPTYSYEKRLKFKLISIMFIFIYFSIYFLIKDNPYFINFIWVIVLQTSQILITKGGFIYEDFKNYFKKTT